MTSHQTAISAGIAAALLAASAGCGGREAPQAPPTAAPPATTPAARVERIEATPENVTRAREALERAADRDRRARACLTFDDFKATVYKEPWEGGKYIVNGDTPIIDDKQLLEFYEQSVKARPQARLILHQVSGMDAKWNQQQKQRLAYCVSQAFGARHGRVVQDMENATREWEKSAAVDFVHDPAHDGNCTAANDAVVFDVRPVNVETGSTWPAPSSRTSPAPPATCSSRTARSSCRPTGRCSRWACSGTSSATPSGSATSTPGRTREPVSRTATGSRSPATTRSR
jgi:hypothetical protein